MGGLINELEQKIQACNILQNEYEKNINFLSNRNENYNYVYKETFKPDWPGINYINKNIYKDVINYRQSLIDDICYNNNLIKYYQENLRKNINISTFLQKLYFFIIFNIKKQN